MNQFMIPVTDHFYFKWSPIIVVNFSFLRGFLLFWYFHFRLSVFHHILRWKIVDDSPILLFFVDLEVWGIVERSDLLFLGQLLRKGHLVIIYLSLNKELGQGPILLSDYLISWFLLILQLSDLSILVNQDQTWEKID